MKTLRLARTFCALVLLRAAKPLTRELTGIILGTVTEPSGAVILGANVILTKANKELSRDTATGTRGSCEFLAVRVGVGYTAEIGATGFARRSQSCIKLPVN